MCLLLQVEPHEAGHLLAHELGATLVGLVVILDRLGPHLLVAGLVQRIRRGLEVLLPLLELLPELLRGEPLRRGNERDAVPHDEVELPVPVHVGDPDPGRPGRAGEVTLVEGLAVRDLPARLDQRPEFAQFRGLALAGLVLRPVDAAVAGAAQQVQVPVAVPVDDERVAVVALDPQRRAAGRDQLGLGRELALALPLEPVERAGEVAHDQVEVAVAVPVDGEGPRADLLGQFFFPRRGDDEGLAVGPLQDLGLAERAVGFAVEDLEQARHVLVHAGVRAGEDVEVAVAVDVHELWSRGRASPNARHFGVLTLRLQPGALDELHPAQALADLDLALVELADEEVRLAVAVDVGPAGRRVAGGLDADRGPARGQAGRGLELGGAAQGGAADEPARCEQSLSHGVSSAGWDGTGRAPARGGTRGGPAWARARVPGGDGIRRLARPQGPGLFPGRAAGRNRCRK